MCSNETYSRFTIGYYLSDIPLVLKVFREKEMLNDHCFFKFPMQ